MTKPRKNPWRAAREHAELTMDDVMVAVRNAFPEDRPYWVSKAKIARKETGKNASIPTPALAFMAKLYGSTLEELDAEAAARLDRDAQLHVVWAARGSNPEPAGLGVSVPGDGLGFEVEPRYEAA